MSDTRKAPIDLVPLRAIIGAARVFAHGNRKTKTDGTPFPVPRQPGDFIERKLDGVFYASTLRHVMELQLLNGIVTPESLAHLDHDTNLPTIDHAICNLLIIRTMLIRDRLLPEDPGPGRGVLKHYDPRSVTITINGIELKPMAEPEFREVMPPQSMARHTVPEDEKGPGKLDCSADRPCRACTRWLLSRGKNLQEFENNDLDAEIAEGFGDTKED